MKTCRLLILAALVAGFLGLGSNAWAQTPTDDAALEANATVASDFSLNQEPGNELQFGTVTPDIDIAGISSFVVLPRQDALTTCTAQTNSNCSGGDAGEVDLTSAPSAEVTLSSVTAEQSGGGISCSGDSGSDVIQLHSVLYHASSDGLDTGLIGGAPSNTFTPTDSGTVIFVGGTIDVDPDDDPALYTCSWTLVANNT